MKFECFVNVSQLGEKRGAQCTADRCSHEKTEHPRKQERSSFDILMDGLKGSEARSSISNLPLRSACSFAKTEKKEDSR